MGALLVTAACANDRLPEQITRSRQQPQQFNSEEEVFGNLNGFNGTNYYVQIAARDSQSSANQPSYQDIEMWATPTGHDNKGAYFGWFGYGGTYPECKSLTNTTSNATEEHSDASGSPPNTSINEAHCVNAGRLQLLLGSGGDFLHPLTIGARTFQRPVDWVNYPYVVGSVAAEDTVLGADGGHTEDVKLTFDSVSEAHSITSAILFDAVRHVSDGPWGSTTVNAGDTLKAPANFWLRFGAWNSTGQNASDPSLLVRYFWDYGSNKSDRSGFTDTYLGDDLLRVKKFAQGTHTVIAQLAAGDQYGADSDGTWGTTKQFYVNAYTPLTAGISPTPAYIVLNDSLSLSDTGSNGSGSNTFSWKFGRGSPKTGNPVKFAWDSIGTYTDSVTKTDSHSFTVKAAGTVNVVSAPGVSIHGMYTNQSGAVKSNQTCSFRADQTGGGGPTTYQWYVNGSAAGTGHFQDVSVGSSNFTVKVVLYNADDSASATKSVGVSGTGQVCS